LKSFACFLAGILVGALALHTATAQSPRPNALNHVGLVVEDYDKAYKFYTDALGFREAYTMKNSDGSPLLTYLQLNRETFVELIPARASDKPGITHFGVEVGNLEAAADRLKSRGYTVPAIGRTPANARYFRIRDTNNDEIEVMEFGPDALQRKAMESWKP
jgi:catechol 2,3-dioxygenase-like lactoylglutathione lyase family enzyme